MSLKLTWINHASFRLAGPDAVVYIDPWKIAGTPHDGDVVLVSHGHHDHLSPDDIARVSRQKATTMGPADVAAGLAGCRSLAPGDRAEAGGVAVQAVRAYNVGKKFHPHDNNWLGLVVEMDGKRVYYAGDTDVIDEMSDVGPVDLALLPVGGTYTMDAPAAAQAAARVQAARIVPYHWGDIVGDRSDAEALAKSLGENVTILDPGESLTLG